jgi:hypothetical protein
LGMPCVVSFRNPTCRNVPMQGFACFTSTSLMLTNV